MENGVKTVCAKNQCVGCMACFDMCPKSAITIVDTRQAYNAVIDEEKCTHCGICTNVCQNNKAANLKAFMIVLIIRMLYMDARIQLSRQ